ncbi:hypothetical protein [Candidatus Magnetobacterium casense]|uniref:PIN domain-containing protein n=1 Tax=Candidatus Magnetobacterium casense TaxID=1455061 RepID=A0ABS6RXC3_9BACT|nr:hypothetical protein [Candidatus Magnetobacterium casensis]MBV6340689.1 hypothetical protein [Candidatus Magnetobacterium casensis]
MNNKLFFDTTAVIDYIFKPEKKRFMKPLIDNAEEIATTQYTLMELKTGYLKNIILLYYKLSENNDLSDLLEYTQKLSYKPNILNTWLEAFSNLYKQKKQYYNELKVKDMTREIKELLGEMILDTSVEVKKLFKGNITNEMECFKDLKFPYIENSTLKNDPTSCKNSKEECNIKEFFEQNKSSFEKILTLLKKSHSSDDETKKRIYSLEEILTLLNDTKNKFSNKTPNLRHCWKCSDAIIAVSAPNDYAILNNNKKHFDPICEAINKESINY